MSRVAVLAAALIALMSSDSFGKSFTVYQGGSDIILGTCSTRSECRQIKRANPGRGERIVNNNTGQVVNKPGHSEFAHHHHKK